MFANKIKLFFPNCEPVLRNLSLQLQAWWRGCMVRRGLGSKKEEPKKGKKKNKEGKKKKK